MDIDPLQLDVNIHPSKTEVKFENEPAVYSLLHAMTKKALGSHHAGGKIDFGLDANFASHMRGSDKKSDIKASVAAHKWQALQQAAALEAEHNLSPYDFSEEKRPPQSSPQTTTKPEAPKPPPSPSNLASTQPLPLDTSFSPEEWQKYPLFLLEGGYLCKPLRGKLLIIDSRRARERILYERFVAQKSSDSAAQHMMFSEKLPFDVADLELFSSAQKLLQQAGFLYQVDKEAIQVKGLPVGLAAVELAPLFEALLHALQEEYKPEFSGPQKAFWRLTAAQLAARQPALRNETEMQALVDALYVCNQNSYTPTGARIFLYLETDNLKQLLKE